MSKPRLYCTPDALCSAHEAGAPAGPCGLPPMPVESATSAAPIALSVRRWRFDSDTPGARGRWWYTVTLAGARGASYEVEIVHPDGMRLLPFKTSRRGRTTRTVSTAAGARRALELAAIAAIEAL